jgi:hypothetical protein
MLNKHSVRLGGVMRHSINRESTSLTPNIHLEIKVIKKFVDKAKQNRYVQFVSSSKNRHKFIGDLAHLDFFQWHLFEPVKGIEEQTILQMLKANGVANKTCYVISENHHIDAKILDTKEAIGETIGNGMGTILVFGDAEVIFFESETVNTRFISKKVK